MGTRSGPAPEAKPWAGIEKPIRMLVAQARRPFVRHAGTLQAGSLAALGLNFVLSIALARVMGLEAYGSFALVVSTMTTISLFKRLGQDYIATTDMAAGYARGDRSTVQRALSTFNSINLWSTVVVTPVALIFAPQIMHAFFGHDGLSTALRLSLLPPIWAPLLATLLLTLQCTQRFGALTLLENLNTVLLSLAALIGAFLALRGSSDAAGSHSQAEALVEAALLAQVGVSLLIALLAAWMYQTLAHSDALVPTWRALARLPYPWKKSVREELRAGLAVALDKNLVSLYPLIPILLLGVFAPTGEVALLRVAMSFVLVPLVAINAVSRLLMVKLPEIHATQPERMQRFFIQVTITAGVLSLALTLPFLLLAPWLIGTLYGESFAPAALLVPLLILDPLTAGFGLAAGPIFRTYRKNMLAVYTNVGVLAAGLPIAYLTIQGSGLEAAALAYALMVSAVRLIAYLLCLRLTASRACAS